jgi:CRISPR-associated protein Csb2
MASALVISIRLHEGRYHGAGEWPPAPARLFQALVAGIGLSGPLDHRARETLEWLERLNAPVIGAPRKRDGHSVALYVPNNDLDKVGGDPRRIAEIRGSRKIFRPRLFDPTIPFVYAWMFDKDQQDGTGRAAILMELAERVYQFGRGVDFACAWGEALETEALAELFLAYPGTIHRPSLRGEGLALKCPMPGSLKSLDDRYRASERRFRSARRGRTTTQVFTKLPSPLFAPIAYDSPAWRYSFELRERSDEAGFAAWPLAQVVRLVELVRDGAVARLCSALPSRRADIDLILKGRKPDGSNGGSASERVRILPLPSIGHHYADRGIRRALIEGSSSCPLQADDIAWAFSGLELANPNAGDAFGTVVTPAEDESGDGMLAHYGIGGDEAHRRWRTVTPAALPEQGARRRIDPKHRLDEVKGGRERAEECALAAGAVVQALRHAGVAAHVRAIRVQREPFESNGERVEMFADGTRFSKHRLWHVEIEFVDGILGPVVIGDGRFLGLGIMAPAQCR